MTESARSQLRQNRGKQPWFGGAMGKQSPGTGAVNENVRLKGLHEIKIW